MNSAFCSDKIMDGVKSADEHSGAFPIQMLEIKREEAEAAKQGRCRSRLPL